MERESTAEKVSRRHPDCPLSNCGKVSRQSVRMPLAQVLRAGEAEGWCWGGAHLLSVLLQEQQQLTEVVESEARHLGPNCVSFQVATSYMHANYTESPWLSLLVRCNLVPFQALPRICSRQLVWNDSFRNFCCIFKKTQKVWIGCAEPNYGCA